VEWSECSRLARSAEALAHAPVMDHKIPHGLHHSCHHHMRPGGRSAILHMMVFLWLRTAMTSPSVPPQRWRTSHHHPDHRLGKTLQRVSSRWKGSDDSNIGWMTLHTCKRRCKPPSIHRPAWCMTASVASGLTLMLKSYKDLSLGEVTGAQVWVLTCLVSFSVFLVISLFVLPVGHITTVAMIASKYCFY
jgi:hypothetical protein